MFLLKLRESVFSVMETKSYGIFASFKQVKFNQTHDYPIFFANFAPLLYDEGVLNGHSDIMSVANG